MLRLDAPGRCQGVGPFSFSGECCDGEVVQVKRVPQWSDDPHQAAEGWQTVIQGPMGGSPMAGGMPTEMGPMPGDPGGAMGMAGFAGGGEMPMAQPLQTDVQEQLRNAALQLRDWHRSIDAVLQGVQGLSVTMPTQGEGAQKVTALADALKKELTTVVMNTIRQAPGPGAVEPQMPVMAG